MRGVGMIEARGRPRLAEETIGRLPLRGEAGVEDLDRGEATEERLLGAVDGAVAALADPLFQHEVTERPADERITNLRLRAHDIDLARPYSPMQRAWGQTQRVEGISRVRR